MHATVVLYVVLIATATLLNLCDGRITCTPCMNRLECEEPPKDPCVWGENRDNCGWRVCAKGPGEYCGGTSDMMGICGEGMMCTTTLHDPMQRCRGCSTFGLIQCYA